VAPEYQHFATGSGPNHHGLLARPAVEHWGRLLSQMAATWKNDPKAHALLLGVKSCLDKLSASLLQVGRLKEHHDNLIAQAKTSARTGTVLIAIGGLEALADFEGLLLHARAALDRLTWFLSARFKNRTQSFRSLQNVLVDHQARPDAAALLPIVKQVRPWFDSLLASIDGEESLRDLVGHKHSLSEGVETCFSIANVSPNRSLVFDCEVGLLPGRKAVPILSSTHAIAQHLSFVVLSCLGVVLEQAPLTLDAYAPTWTPLTSVRTAFLTDEPAGSPLGPTTLLTVRRMTPSGFETAQWNYRQELWERSIDLDAV